MATQDCIFCKIVHGELPCHKMWEDEHHLAFLSIFPNTKGFTVITTKEHLPSDALENDDEVLERLTLATKKVSQMIKRAFPDVGRCGMFFEGFGVDHLHSKLFPMHGTGDMKQWEAIESKHASEDMLKRCLTQDGSLWFETYPGFLCSKDGRRASDEELERVAEKMREKTED